MKGITLAALLMLCAGLAQADQLKSTFVFSTPYIDQRGDSDPKTFVQYPEIIIYSPITISESFPLTANLGGHTLDGSCVRFSAGWSCHLSGAFVTFTLNIRKDKEGPWGEINAVSGMFTTEGPYNLIGLLKSEILP